MLTSFSASGELRWSRTFGQDSEDEFLELAAGPGDEVLLVARFRAELIPGKPNPEEPVIAFRVDKDGATSWSSELRRVGHFHQAARFTAVFAPDGNVTVTEDRVDMVTPPPGKGGGGPHVSQNVYLFTPSGSRMDQ